MSVRQWLVSLSMTQYHDLFISSGFDTLAKCSTITDFDLDRIGVTPAGHRKRLLSHLKTALDFSTVRPENQSLPERYPTSEAIQAVAVGELIDLRDPDSLDVVVSKEPKHFPIDLPPKLRNKGVNDLLGSMDGNSDADKRKPVPLPRQSMHINQIADTPVPKPRVKKQAPQNVLGVSEPPSAKGVIVQDACESPNQLSCEEKLYLDVMKSDDKFNTSDCEDGVVYTDVVFGCKMPSNSNSNLNGKIVELRLAPALDCAVGIKPTSECSFSEAVSPDTMSVQSLPISASYEGDVEDSETPGGEVYFDPFCVKPNVPGGCISKDDASWYAGVWDMTSGSTVGLSRHEIKSDVSGDEICSIGSEDQKKAIPSNVIPVAASPAPRPVLPTFVRPPMLSPPTQKPPPVPARKPDLRCTASAPSESSKDSDMSNLSSTRLILSESEASFPSDIASDPSLILPATFTPTMEIETPPGLMVEGMIIGRPQFPAPPLHSTPAQTGGVHPHPQIPLQPLRNAPHPPGVVEQGKVLHPAFPSPPVRPAPSPPVIPGEASSSRPVPASAVIPSQPGSLDVKVLPPARSGPPPLPPKVGVLVSDDTTYSLAGRLEDDDFIEETETPSDASFAESDDTLSDGGEFHDIGFRRPSTEVLRQSIPIISSTSNRQTNRKGYLHKLTSKSKKLTKLGPPWQKRWVIFNGVELRYFSSNKSFVSKRIIPLCTMVNVDTEIKNSDLHPYCFKLATIDRVYTFAADDVDDLSWWANIIMQAIIQSKNEREPFVEGGEMNPPDIQGYVRMEGSKSKRYLVVKKAKFCFYNTINDFRSFTPIHRVEMQLASVKDVGRFKLQLFTPHVAFMLIFESQDELNQWKEVFEDSILQGLGDDSVITEVYANHSNRGCADCEMPDPEWSSINLGITLCKFCAGVHRSFSWSKVRSLRMDSKVWKPSVIQLLITVGNDNSNSFWEWKLPKDDKIRSTADPTKRKDFIVHKYCDKLYCRFHPSYGQQNELNEALCKMVQFGNVLETLELVYSGADVLCNKNNETPIQLARRAKQVLQEEFLYVNGGDWDASQSPTGVGSRSSGICHRGFLFKTGSNVKGEFLRRWCTLENGVFSYFDTDRSTVANDIIERKDMLSIGLAADDRYDYTFEVGTTKQGGRMFLFAAESNDDRMLWMTKLAKVIANIDPTDVEKITPLDRGGNIYIRSGTSREWVLTWAQISHKTVKIFNKKDHLFEEVDLRKAKSITYRHPSERCVESFDEGPPFVVDLRNATNLYIQGDIKNETERWFSIVQRAMMEADRCLANQSLTSDNVPVIVEKCIGFIVLYALEVEGIYRLNGQHSKVTRLLELFMSDACGLVIKQDEFQVHDVSNTLKRFFRSSDDPLLTQKLYGKWIEAAGLPDFAAKFQWYKFLLKELPQINYCTLKQVITHLARVAELDRINKMTITNLASIFGPVLMRLDAEKKDSGYGATNLEINVVKDLIENHVLLFEVKEEELEQEKKIEEARKKIEKLNNQTIENQVEQMQDVLIGVYISNKDGDIISLKVSTQMRVQELQNYVIDKAGLNATLGWSLFEIICNGELERPLHHMEGVIDITLKWISWPMEFCRDNYLCLKINYIYEKILLMDDLHPSMFCELKYASKKNFHKCCFDFSRYCLTYRTNARATVPTASWNVEDLIIYVGCQKQRNPSSKWCFSFIGVGEQLVSPYFGHCICCSSGEELYRWLSVLLRAQHPGGLISSGSPIGASSQSGSVPMRPHGSPSADQETSSDSSRGRWMKPMSIFQKLNLR